MPFELTRVTIESFDEHEVFEGLINPKEVLNGWLVPYFTYSEVQKIKPIVNRIGEGQLGITLEGDKVLEFLESESWEVPTIIENGITYYGIGDGYRWEIAE